MDKAAPAVPAPEKPTRLLGKIKYIFTISTVLGLLSTNIATLTSDTAHTRLFDGLKQILGYAFADHLANRLVSHSPTVSRKSDVVIATAVLEQEKKEFQSKRDLSDQHNQKILAEHDDLKSKHQKLATDHNNLVTKHAKALQIQENQAATAKKVATKIAPRVMHTATRAVSSLPAKVAPLAGTALTVGMTLWDLNDMCETLKDINDLNAAFGHPKFDQDTICGIKIPGT